MQTVPARPQKKKVLIASIQPHRLTDLDAFQDLKELKELVDSYGGKVVEYVIQQREVHDKGQYLGAGKVKEIASLIKERDIAVVVLNAIVKPGHLYDMKNVLRKTRKDIEVWDRVDLILQIFSLHANTTEAKLQIEIASMRHMGPRIYGMGHVLSRQGGSIGTRGIGETNTELMKRHWRDQMKKAQDKLEKLSLERERQMQRRKKAGLKTISLIGYTNAGKTSLFNKLTGKQKLVENALFATLDSSVGKVFIPEVGRDVLITDTIGFIRNLPARLIDAFRSTLMESIHADLLLHVIDASDPDMERKITAVREVLFELRVHKKPQIFVFNKMDALQNGAKKQFEERYASFHPVFLSVREEKGFDALFEAIGQELSVSGHPLSSSVPVTSTEIV